MWKKPGLRFGDKKAASRQCISSGSSYVPFDDWEKEYSTRSLNPTPSLPSSSTVTDDPAYVSFDAWVEERESSRRSVKVAPSLPSSSTVTYDPFYVSFDAWVEDRESRRSLADSTTADTSGSEPSNQRQGKKNCKIPKGKRPPASFNSSWGSEAGRQVSEFVGFIIPSRRTAKDMASSKVNSGSTEEQDSFSALPRMFGKLHMTGEDDSCSSLPRTNGKPHLTEKDSPSSLPHTSGKLHVREFYGPLPREDSYLNDNSIDIFDPIQHVETAVDISSHASQRLTLPAKVFSLLLLPLFVYSSYHVRYE